MKPEQKMGIIFSILGIAMGAASSVVGILYASFAIPVAAYVGAVFLASRMEKEKKIKWIVTHSVGTFFLTWIVSWIFILNTW